MHPHLVSITSEHTVSTVTRLQIHQSKMCVNPALIKDLLIIRGLQCERFKLHFVHHKTPQLEQRELR